MSKKILLIFTIAITILLQTQYQDAVAQPILEIDVSSIELVLVPGESHEETFNITNVGNATLSYQLDFTYVGEPPHVLVVDDDGSLNNSGSYTSVEQFYTDALDSAGINYDFYVVEWTISPEQPGPDAEYMSNYDLVIWFTGEAWGIYGDDTITLTDEINLGQYLSGGGNLFLSSQDYFFVMYSGIQFFQSGMFPHDYLGVTTTQQDMWSPPSSCQGGEESFARGMSFQCQVPYMTETLWTDMIQGEGLPLLTVETQPAALQYNSGEFKAAFTALSFEGLADGSSTRAQFMENLLDWIESDFPMQQTRQTEDIQRWACTPPPADPPTAPTPPRHRESARHRPPHSAPSAGRLPAIQDATVSHNLTPRQPTETDDPWLFLNPEVGSVEPQESELITASFIMPDTTEPGDFYEGTILIENNSASSPAVIPVMVLIEASVADESIPTPADFALYQNYPNPFNPTTDIRFQIPFNLQVTLSVYDILGQNVATLINQNVAAGGHSVTFDGSALASGIYFCRLETPNFSAVRKMILLR
jgi:hypothetical protein